MLFYRWLPCNSAIARLHHAASAFARANAASSVKPWLFCLRRARNDSSTVSRHDLLRALVGTRVDEEQLT